MAKITQDGTGVDQNQNGQTADQSPKNTQRFDAQSEGSIEIGGSGFMSHAVMTQEGHDLVLTGPDGHVVIIENYFLTEPQPDLTSPEGQVLSPQLVNSFLVHNGPVQYAGNETYTDESAIGIVSEYSGEATVTRTDGSTHTLQKGMAIFQGDIIETDFEAAVNITFIDESSFSIGEDARMAIDEFVFDPATNEGTTDVSILRGVFMYTSGLMGRDNPDSVDIETPVGSIGIRGTIIGGKITPNGEGSQITVVEGAIVVTNGTGQQILSSQFETIQLGGFNSPMQNIGQIDAVQMNQSYGSVRSVSGNLFSSIDDAAANQNNGNNAADSGGEGNADAQGGDSQNSDTQGNSEQSAQGEGTAEGQSEGETGQEGEGEGESEAEAESGEAEGEGEVTDPLNDPVEDSLNNNQNDNDLIQQANNTTQNSGQDGTGRGSATGGTSGNNNTGSSDNTPQQFIDRAPNIQILQVNNVVENDTNQVVLARLAIRDPDAQDNVDISRFRIGGFLNGTGPIDLVEGSGEYEYLLIKKAGETLDFEANNPNSDQAVGIKNLTIHAFDNDSQSVKSFNVPLQVTNVNEAPELALNYRLGESTYNLNENGVGSKVVARLNVNEQDRFSNFNDNSFVITDARFEVVQGPAGGLLLVSKPGVTFDHETESLINLDIHIEDNTNPSLKSATFNIDIDINDINDAPTIDSFTQTTTNFAENEAGLGAAVTVGTISASDADMDSGFNINQYVLSDSRFEIDGGNIQAKAGAIFDYETESSITLNIAYQDTTDGTLRDTRTMTINITDVNDEAPTDILFNDATNSAPFTGSINEDFALYMTFLTFEAVDADATNTFTYTLSGTDSALFTIASGNELQFNGTIGNLDFETQSSFTVDVQVDDGAGNTFDKTLTFNLNDLEETPSDLMVNDDVIFDNIGGTDYAHSVTTENYGALLGTIQISDPENTFFTPGDFSINDPGGDPYHDYFEVIENFDVNGDPEFVLKLQNDVRIIWNGTDFEFEKTGAATGHTIALDGNGKYALDVEIEIYDAAAAASYVETFIFSVEENIIDMMGLNGNDGFFIYNDARNIGLADPAPLFGRSVATGDFDGDGTLDFASSAPGAFNSTTEEAGGIYIIDGNPTDPIDVNRDGLNNDRRFDLSDLTMGGHPGFFEESEDASDNNGDLYGKDIANLGDVNGDGVDDIIVSIAGQNAVRILFGGGQGSLDITNFNLGGLAEIAVAAAGDVNGDGLNDIMIGTPGTDLGGYTDNGEIHIIYGEAGMQNIVGPIDITSPAALAQAPSLIDGNSTTNGDFFGENMARIGDFNGDGYDDVLVSETGWNGGNGRVHLMLGGTSGVNGISASFTSGITGASLGVSVTGIGDINDDGLDDFLIGAPDANTGDGVAYVVYGDAAAPTGTIDIETHTVTNGNGFRIDYGAGASGDEGLGYSAASAGDFNGDGIDDFIITGTNGQMIDQAFIVFGGQSFGSNLMLDAILANPSMGMLLTYSDNLDMDATFNEDQFLEVTAAGDVNEDGYDDIMIGVDDFDEGQGASYIIYGRDTDIASATIEWVSHNSFESTTADGQTFMGNSDNNWLDSMEFDITANGAAGDDLFRTDNTQFALFDGGSGFDLLKLNFSSEESGSATADVIDLRGIGQGTVGDLKNIEEIFIFSDTLGGGDDTLQMDIKDVLDLLHQSEDGRLIFSTDVNNNNEVRFFDDATGVTLTGNGFTDDANGDLSQDTVIYDGETYYEYTLIGTDYTVLLDSQLNQSELGGAS